MFFVDVDIGNLKVWVLFLKGARRWYVLKVNQFIDVLLKLR